MDTPTAVETRVPIGFANYAGDCRQILTQGPHGPNYMGELMWPVTAEYDPAIDRTRVGFSLQPPPEEPVRGTSRVVYLPEVAGAEAPTLAELERGVDLS